VTFPFTRSSKTKFCPVTSLMNLIKTRMSTSGKFIAIPRSFVADGCPGASTGCSPTAIPHHTLRRTPRITGCKGTQLMRRSTLELTVFRVHLPVSNRGGQASTLHARLLRGMQWAGYAGVRAAEMEALSTFRVPPVARSATRARRAGAVRRQRLRIRRRNAMPAMPASNTDAPSNPHGVSVGALAAALAHVPT